MITCSNIGHFGRWGNSLFQYAGARVAAEMIGTELRVPIDWIGRKVFCTIYEGPIERELPKIAESEWDGQDNVDITGYFQSEKWVSRLSKSKLKKWLVPRNWYDGPEVAIHKRRGDYVGNGYYALVSDASYDKAVQDFGRCGATIKTYHCESKSDQYMDFVEIMKAKAIFRSNSTFSWWAATLSNATVYSPVVGDLTGWQDVPFVEGNHPKLVSLFSDLHIQP